MASTAKALCIVALFVAALALLPATRAEVDGLYIIFEENFSDIGDWTYYEGDGNFTTDGGVARLKSTKPSKYLIYQQETTFDSGTHGSLTILINNMTVGSRFWVWMVTPFDTYLVANVSQPGNHTITFTDITHGEPVQLILIESLEGSVIIDYLMVHRTRPPNLGEIAEFAFAQFQAQNPYTVPAILLLVVLGAFLLAFGPPREKRATKKRKGVYPLGNF